MGIRLLRLSNSTNNRGRTATASDGGAASTVNSMSGHIIRMPKRVHHSGSKRRYTVSDLSLPRGGGHIWRRSFVPLLLAWAGAHEDPFGANSDLYDVVTDIWSRVFPRITLGVDDTMVLVKVVRHLH